MEDRIREALENSAEFSGEFDQIDDSKAFGKLKAKQEDDEKRTVKIVMGNKSGLKEKSVDNDDRSQSEKASARSKENPREKQTDPKGRLIPPLKKRPLQNSNSQVQQATRKSKELREDDQDIRASLRAFEEASLKQGENKGMRNTDYTARTRVSDFDQERLPRQEVSLSTHTNVPENGMKSSSKQECRVFEERETSMSFWQFIGSKQVSVYKKLGNLLFLLFFIGCCVANIISLSDYIDSSCKVSTLATILYITYCGIGLLLRFSSYIFLQMEYHGKINYTIGVPHFVPLYLQLVIAGMQTGVYSYGFRSCTSISAVFKDKEDSWLLMSRLFIIFVAFGAFYTISSLFTMSLSKTKKPSVKSFVNIWMGLIQLLFWLLITVLAVVTLIMVFSQGPLESLGLALDILQFICILLSSAVVLVVQRRTGQDPLALPPATLADSSEEKERLSPKPPANSN